MERTVSNEQVSEGKGTPQDTCRCSISVHSKRKRLADPDGISAKAAIDGLVLAGVLVDDSCKYVSEVRFTQEQSKVEETIITLEWC